ncbi:hypothetical protein VTN00DRAFT_376 [Thermoascus crustaceus]|uniref:uncharacterized protein n=1 Tax=Thermoascus crustaceus TaxID=5088 RepID=UPI0037432FB4
MRFKLGALNPNPGGTGHFMGESGIEAAARRGLERQRRQRQQEAEQVRRAAANDAISQTTTILYNKHQWCGFRFSLAFSLSFLSHQPAMAQDLQGRTASALSRCFPPGIVLNALDSLLAHVLRDARPGLSSSARPGVWLSITAKIASSHLRFNASALKACSEPGPNYYCNCS